MKLRFMKGRMSGHMVDVLPTGFVVGRGESCDLAIDEEGISRRHARIFFEDGTWFVEDLGSTNGVRINGTKVTGRFCIKPGDRIGLFNQTMLFTDDTDVVDVDALAVGTGGTATRNVATVSGTPAAAVSSPIPPGSPASVAPQSNMSSVKVIFLLLLVAGLAWFAKETFKTDRAEPKAGAASETVDVEAGSEAEEVTIVKEPPAVVVEMPGMENPQAVEEPPAIVQVKAFDGQPAAAVDGGPGEQAVGNVFIESVPTGADVSVGGIPRGKTPLMLRNMAGGQYELTLSALGYEDLKRQIRVPDGLPNRPFVMQLKAGAVLINSEPQGATVFHGTQLLGTTPFVVTDLPVGNQEVRLTKVGFETTRETIMVSAADGVKKTIAMESLLGGVEFVTVPAGCNIYIDNIYKGKTVRADAQNNKSVPLRVTGLKEGEHLARVEHPNGAAKSDILHIKRGTVERIVVELWVVDTKLTLKDGRQRFGMLSSVSGVGDVIISEKTAGEKKPTLKQYFKEQILAMETLTVAEGREQMEKMGEAQVAKTAVENAVHFQPPEDVPGKNDVSPEPTGPLSFTVRELTALIRENSATALSKTVGDREVILTGVPTDIVTNLVRAEIHFGRDITCELPRKTYDLVSYEIKDARDTRQAITIRGKTVAHAHQAVTLRNCTYIPEAEITP